jgi:hypothetical protein
VARYSVAGLSGGWWAVESSGGPRATGEDRRTTVREMTVDGTTVDGTTVDDDSKRRQQTTRRG